MLRRTGTRQSQNDILGATVRTGMLLGMNLWYVTYHLYSYGQNEFANNFSNIKSHSFSISSLFTLFKRTCNSQHLPHTIFSTRPIFLITLTSIWHNIIHLCVYCLSFSTECKLYEDRIFSLLFTTTSPYTLVHVRGSINIGWMIVRSVLGTFLIQFKPTRTASFFPFFFLT